MAIPYALGPQLLYVQFPSSVGASVQPLPAGTGSTGSGARRGGRIQSGGTRIRFLGTGELSPNTEFRREWESVFNDVSGKVPLDLAFAGEQAFVSVDLTRWNWAVYSLLATQPMTISGTEGFNGPLETGALMLTESLNTILFIVNTFGAKPVYVANAMPTGYRFPGAVFAGPDRISGGAAKPAKIHVTWHCLSVYDGVSRSKLLRDNNLSGLPAPD